MKRLLLSLIAFLSLFGCKSDMLFDTKTEAIHYFMLEIAQKDYKIITQFPISHDEEIIFFEQNNTISHLKLSYEEGSYRIIEFGGSYSLPVQEDYSFIAFSMEDTTILIGKVFDSSIKSLVYKTPTESEQIELNDDGYFYFITDDYYGNIELN